MAKKSKRYLAMLEKVDKTKLYGLREAIELLKELPTAKFDETVEMHIRLNVDPRHADQQVRGTITLPHGTGQEKRVLVIASGEKMKEAEEAGADYVGGEDMVQKIEGGWLDFDAVIATPDMMRVVGRLGRILGPRGLMPSAKTGTVTFDVAEAIKEIKAGRIEYRVDRYGIIHVVIGKMSFAPDMLFDNAKALLRAVLRARPAAVKGRYVRSIAIAPTMGVGIKIDPIRAQKEIVEE
ncbi:MAG: 50S ribosomal protein L1 [Acetomicrobium sp.]|jgi:large subunit ribosomal protein L1|uniref:50S ribosomal protein L1 n=1 Tax=Acetomicrobium TaxID=49894 RepID=UPI0016B1D5B4|nr:MULTISPECIES: 50S ribosomal protein L1 [Acetomicrobium]MDI9376526.1 50S ribosomal protein L1 [Synergistota bacterium]NLI43276.1 50S ribosomal protein L1 [Synergistaceae bacterium]MBP8675239.1 50S ribosomal protein L1 [Acetomicrobium sp.]MDR9770132.1 50S ribosomal protein L1 [Acetomicrobium sp.]HOB11182.1 50S ribosomal protein L1 [Acetomicrobium sp.]